MSEAQTAESTKSKTPVVMVRMEDGREIGFAGKKKILKEYLIDDSKILVDGKTVTLEEGAVKLRMDFRDGATRTFTLNPKMLPTYAGHGASQKFGDELASPASNPLSEEDMVLAVEELDKQINKEESWTVISEGGSGFSGASVVVKAICEASNKAVEDVKAFLQKKLDDAKAKGEKLSRKDLYDSFRNPNSKVGQIIKRMEEERLAKTAKVDADEALAELG